MEDKNQILRAIPQVEKVLQTDEVRRFVPVIGRTATADIVRGVLTGVRARVERGGPADLDGIIPEVAAQCRTYKLRKLQRVINGTGIIIHTNLGRSPVGEDILERLADVMSGYCNLEYGLYEGGRGGRGGFAEELVRACAGAEDALIVNNNASSVFLILNEFAQGREVVVSRGELVQIGGGFRLPDIMRQSGALLVETGTTNITTIDDYRAALTENSAMIFSCHRSNFTMEGFTESPSLQELSSLKNERTIFVRDLGSGNLVPGRRPPAPFEPTVRAELEQGPDLVCFSGDKLLGACQAGIIVGRKDLVSRLRRNPLMRMLRVDKMTYFILQETLLRHDNGELGDISLWRMLLQDRKEMSRRVNRFVRIMKCPDKKKFVKRIDTMSAIGGGSMPGVRMESCGARIDVPGVGADDIFTAFISAEIPLAGSVKDGGFIIDFHAVLDRDVPAAAMTADSVISRLVGSV